MAAAPIDLSAGLVPKPIDISAGLVPKDQPDTRSLYQKAKDNFNANTQGAKPGDGAVKGFVENVGAGGGDVIRSIGHAVLHPYDTVVAGQQAQDAKPFMQKVREAATSGILGPAGNMAIDTAKGLVSQPGRTIGQIGTGAIIGGAAPIVGKAVGNAAIDAIDGTAAAAKRLYPTSQSLAPDVSAARNLSKALVVDPAGVNNFVKSAADEAGTVVGYAKEKGLPINSKVDFANAAKQTADAAQSHYDENILAPNAKQITAVPASYQGPTVGEGNNATLGAINDRINAINSELKSNFRKPLQAQTSAANTSDAELLSEKNALTNVLHNKLGDATGLPPEAIADLRVQAGKLRTIADESQLSANRDTTAAGRQGMGATTTSSIGTKAGIIDRTLQAVQGGPEVIGNRQILSALKKVAPKPLDLPQSTPAEVTPPAPRPPTGGPSITISGHDYTPDPNAAAALRDKISARQAVPIKQMQQWANSGAAKLVQHDPNLTTADIELLNKSPVGKQILIKASSLTPGSPAMESLFPQIQAALSAK